MSAGEAGLFPLAEAVGAAQQVIDDYVRTAAAAWGEELAARLEPMREAIRLGRMDGWAACRDGRGLGLAVYLERARGARVSFAHVLAGCSEQGLPARLIGHAVARLRAGGCRQITSQANLVAHQEAIHDAYLSLGFTPFERVTMSVTLPSPALERLETRTKVVPPPPSAYELVAWDDTYLDQVAKLFHNANRDTLDARIYPQFKTYEETRRMAGAIRDGGAGRFVEEASCIVLHGGEPCGAIMLVQPELGQGFVVVVAVAPGHQGRGLGWTLVSRALAAARQAGIQAVDLTVTEENRPGVTLYQRLGFMPKRRMTAYVWEATS